MPAMPEKPKTYIAIDLKSFYASVECMERGLDPLDTNLVVADASRTEKTICLAVSPALKAYGIPGRPRLFEVVQKVRDANTQRKRQAKTHTFSGESHSAKELADNPELSISYVTAPPRMSLYLDYSRRIYEIYLRYVAPEDLHAYSVDEVFLDITEYLGTYRLTPRELTRKIIQDVLCSTGITATAGIGTNLYLCKIAMDIVAKHIPADKDGVRIAELDEISYRRQLWTHRPLTDFWRIGRGYAAKLEANGLFTMGDIARCSIGKAADYYNEDLLYRLFGINAELLIDHAWGWEPCTIADIRQYQPEENSICSGQVLSCPYDYEKTKLVIREMADQLSLALLEKRLVTDQLVLTIGYDVENLTVPELSEHYQGEVTTDRYGRRIPKHAHGTINLHRKTSSSRLLTDAAAELYDRIINPALLTRRINLTAARVIRESQVTQDTFEQLDLFTDYDALRKQQEAEEQALKKERQMQQALLSIKKKYGKNAILKGMNFEEGATAIDRNSRIGGHKA